MTNADSWTLYTINEICQPFLYIFDPGKRVQYLNVSLGILPNSSSDARSTGTMIAVPCAVDWNSGHTLALLLFPSLVGPFFPFIFLAENPRRSAVEVAPVLFENRFFPPKPCLSSFFCLLFCIRPLPSPLWEVLEERPSLVASSSSILKRSSSFAARVSVLFRSVDETSAQPYRTTLEAGYYTSLK